MRFLNGSSAHAMPPRSADAPAASSAVSADASASASSSLAPPQHPKPRGKAPKSKDRATLCTWNCSRGCWVDADGSDHVVLNAGERMKAARKRDHEAALGGDAEAVKRREAERQRIESRFARTVDEERQRSRQRRDDERTCHE